MTHSPSPAFRRILVLCEGNHCRSPIAEALLKASLGSGVHVESAGLDALVGHPADETARHLLAERGLDLSSHRGRQVTPALALSADLILVMDQAQKEACEQLVPSTRGRIFLLGHWLPPADQEIPDPMGRGVKAFHKALDHIDQSVHAWLPKLAQRSRFI